MIDTVLKQEWPDEFVLTREQVSELVRDCVMVQNLNVAGDVCVELNLPSWIRDVLSFIAGQPDDDEQNHLDEIWNNLDMESGEGVDKYVAVLLAMNRREYEEFKKDGDVCGPYCGPVIYTGHIALLLAHGAMLSDLFSRFSVWMESSPPVRSLEIAQDLLEGGELIGGDPDLMEAAYSGTWTTGNQLASLPDRMLAFIWERRAKHG